MNVNPLVSIVIPVYNGEDFLSEAIESALAQTYQNTEVLVINDGSDDDGKTEKVALSYGDKIKYFSKPNGGVASALNRAVEEMSGEYFSWLSHDDLYSQDKVQQEVDMLVRTGRDDVIIYSDYAVFTKDPEEALAVRLEGVLPEHFRYWITVENRLHGCTLLIPRGAFDKVVGFDESLKTTQDYDLWFRMAEKFSFVHIPFVLVKARSHSGQGSHKMVDLALAECNELLSGFIRGLEPREIMSATSKPLADSYASLASSMFKRGFGEAGEVAQKLVEKAEVASGNKAASMIKNRGDIKARFINLCRILLPMRLKAILRSVFNSVLNERKVKNNQLKEKFSEVYEYNIFGGGVSRSGEGSDLAQTEVIRRELPKIVKEFSVQSFLDAPCGDWYWMKEVDLGVEQYIGVDIVEVMIEKHKIEFAAPARTFACLNLATASLPKVDLIFSRDCLVHLNFDDALKIIANFKKSGSKYLLTTTFVEREQNNDLVGEDSFWRPLNMTLAPFNFPKPLLVVNEYCKEEAGQYTDKCLALWLLSEIEV